MAVFDCRSRRCSPLRLSRRDDLDGVPDGERRVAVGLGTRAMSIRVSKWSKASRSAHSGNVSCRRSELSSEPRGSVPVSGSRCGTTQRPQGVTPSKRTLPARNAGASAPTKRSSQNAGTPPTSTSPGVVGAVRRQSRHRTTCHRFRVAVPMTDGPISRRSTYPVSRRARRSGPHRKIC